MDNIHLHQVICELLTSSSSEEDEEIDFVVLNYNKENNKSIPKIQGFINDVVHNLSDEEFRKHFRMNPNIVTNCLVGEYENSTFYKTSTTWTRGSPMTSAETQILLFIWYAVNKTTLREVAQRFNVSISTAHKSVRKVMEFLVDLAPRYIMFPQTEEDKRKLADSFYKLSGFPLTIGCIDGTSIPITTPAKKIKSTYVNRHDVPALTLQGICDHRKCFIDVFTGVPGKIHDARVLVLSDISKSLPSICDDKYHLLGDSAYPIREWLIVPYRDYGNLTEREIKFNKMLSATRVKIENSFGLLKGRFRQLLQVQMHDVDDISKFIISCCVLHNLCILNEDETKIENVCENEDLENNNSLETEPNLRRLGEIKRESIRIKIT